MSKTPLVDGERRRLKRSKTYPPDPVDADFARRLELKLAAARELLKQMLDVAENADETGYVTDVGFVDLDKLHTKVRTALDAAKEGKL